MVVAGCDRAKPMVGEVPVTGMTCESCTQALTHRLSSLEGVEAATVDLASATATVRYDGAQVQADDLVEAIESVGYGAGEPSVRPAS